MTRFLKKLLYILVLIFERIKSIYWSIKYDTYRRIYNIDSSFRFNGQGTILYDPGSIILGSNSYIGSYSWIQSAEGCEVCIGSNCSLSHFVHIYTSNHCADKDFSQSKCTRAGNVIIGDYCWVGIKSSIMGPVNIGEHAVIGANSLVNRDIPPHSISLGVPAKVIKFKSYITKEQQIEYAVQYKNVMSDKLLASLNLKKSGD